jgi:hypothetical protein
MLPPEGMQCAAVSMPDFVPNVHANPVVPFVLAGCNLIAEGPKQMPFSNDTDTDIVIVHRDEGGNESVLNDPDRKSVIEAWDGSGEHGRMMVITNYDWCGRGSFIARDTDGVEVARRDATRLNPSTCGSWTIGTPPPSASPSSAATPSPSPSAGG